jgi:hypothetical protein
MNRRELLGKLGLSAVAVIPAAAFASTDTTTKNAVGPVLLERVCDGGKSTMSTEDWQQLERDCPNRYKGCGTKFRWYLGTYVTCPGCGRVFCYTNEMLRVKKFFVNS